MWEDFGVGWFNLAIKDSLVNHNYSNAVYLAERQFQMGPTEETRLVLGECYLAHNKNHLAIDIL